MSVPPISAKPLPHLSPNAFEQVARQAGSQPLELSENRASSALNFKSGGNKILRFLRFIGEKLHLIKPDPQRLERQRAALDVFAKITQPFGIKGHQSIQEKGSITGTQALASLRTLNDFHGRIESALQAEVLSPGARAAIEADAEEALGEALTGRAAEGKLKTLGPQERQSAREFIAQAVQVKVATEARERGVVPSPEQIKQTVKTVAGQVGEFVVKGGKPSAFGEAIDHVSTRMRQIAHYAAADFGEVEISRQNSMINHEIKDLSSKLESTLVSDDLRLRVLPEGLKESLLTVAAAKTVERTPSGDHFPFIESTNAFGSTFNRVSTAMHLTATGAAPSQNVSSEGEERALNALRQFADPMPLKTMAQVFMHQPDNWKSFPPNIQGNSWHNFVLMRSSDNGEFDTVNSERLVLEDALTRTYSEVPLPKFDEPDEASSSDLDYFSDAPMSQFVKKIISDRPGS